jgi:predicted CoA-substrate-specific enzyme activase
MAKTAVVDGGELVFTQVVPTGFSSVDAAERLRQALAAAGYNVAALPVVATGYGRVAVPFASKTVTEITCHGRGAAHLFGPRGVVIDIGGQDTKAIVLAGGKVTKFVMNDKCSAGTGKFLEVMANRLGLTQPQLEALARRGTPTQISSVCTVFAESEVISLIGQGRAQEDIAWAVLESIATKVKSLVPQVPDAPYFLTGGLCDNAYLLERLSAQLGHPVTSCPQARFAGALGAALTAEKDLG